MILPDGLESVLRPDGVFGGRPNSTSARLTP